MKKSLALILSLLVCLAPSRATSAVPGNGLKELLMRKWTFFISQAENDTMKANLGRLQAKVKSYEDSISMFKNDSVKVEYYDFELNSYSDAVRNTSISIQQMKEMYLEFKSDGTFITAYGSSPTTGKWQLDEKNRLLIITQDGHPQSDTTIIQICTADQLVLIKEGEATGITFIPYMPDDEPIVPGDKKKN